MPEAKQLWRQLVPQLEAMQVLARIDAQALARYCQYWARWRECEEFLKKTGPTYSLTDKQGKTIGFAAFPQVNLSMKLDVALRKLEAEFGLTPAARPRLTVDDESGPQPHDQKSQFAPVPPPSGKPA